MFGLVRLASIDCSQLENLAMSGTDAAVVTLPPVWISTRNLSYERDAAVVTLPPVWISTMPDDSRKSIVSLSDSPVATGCGTFGKAVFWLDNENKKLNHPIS